MLVRVVGPGRFLSESWHRLPLASTACPSNDDEPGLVAVQRADALHLPSGPSGHHRCSPLRQPCSGLGAKFHVLFRPVSPRACKQMDSRASSLRDFLSLGECLAGNKQSQLDVLCPSIPARVDRLRLVAVSLMADECSPSSWSHSQHDPSQVCSILYSAHISVARVPKHCGLQDACCACSHSALRPALTLRLTCRFSPPRPHQPSCRLNRLPSSSASSPELTRTPSAASPTKSLQPSPPLALAASRPPMSPHSWRYAPQRSTDLCTRPVAISRASNLLDVQFMYSNQLPFVADHRR